MGNEQQTIFEECIKFPEELHSDFAFWLYHKGTSASGTLDVSSFLNNTRGTTEMINCGLENYFEHPEIKSGKSSDLKDEVIRNLQEKLQLRCPIKVTTNNLVQGDCVKYGPMKTKEGIIQSKKNSKEFYITDIESQRTVAQKRKNVVPVSESRITEKDNEPIGDFYKRVVETYAVELDKIREQMKKGEKGIEKEVIKELKGNIIYRFNLHKNARQVIHACSTIDDLANQNEKILKAEQEYYDSRAKRMIGKAVRKSIPFGAMDEKHVSELEEMVAKKMKENRESSLSLKGKLKKHVQKHLKFRNGKRKQKLIAKIGQNLESNLLQTPTLQFGEKKWKTISTYIGSRKPFSINDLDFQIRNGPEGIKREILGKKFPKSYNLEKAGDEFGEDFRVDALHASDKIIGEVMANLTAYKQEEIKSLFLEESRKRGVLNEKNKKVEWRVSEEVMERRNRQEEEVKKVTESKGIDWNLDKTYVFDPNPESKDHNLDPYRIGDEFLEDLVTTFGERAQTGRQSEVAEIAKKIVVGGTALDEKEFRKSLTKPGKIAYDEVIKVMKRRVETPGTNNYPYFRAVFSDRNRLTTRNGEEDLQECGQYMAQRDLIVDEMIQILSQGVKKGSGGIGDDYRIFWNRWNPIEYDLEAINISGQRDKKELQRFTFQVSRDYDVLAEAVKRSGACLNSNNIKTVLKDPATINLVMYGNYEKEKNVPIGYTRNNLCTMNDGSSVLAMDTLEVGHKHFEDNWDKTRTLGLATCQMTLDMGIDYLLGKDARVAYGLRQAFSNNEKKATLRRHGEGMIHIQGQGQYTYGFTGSPPIHRGKSAIMIKNWKGGKENGK